MIRDIDFNKCRPYVLSLLILALTAACATSDIDATIQSDVRASVEANQALAAEAETRVANEAAAQATLESNAVATEEANAQSTAESLATEATAIAKVEATAIAGVVATAEAKAIATTQSKERATSTAEARAIATEQSKARTSARATSTAEAMTIAATVSAERTATAAASPEWRSVPNACKFNAGIPPAFHAGFGSKPPTFTFDEDILKSEGKVGVSEYETTITDVYIEAEFFANEQISFGFEFRNHVDTRVTINNGIAADFIVISYTGFRWEWRHHVRNRFTTSLGFDETLVARGTLNNVVTGPRGWNTLSLLVDGDSGAFGFNGVPITSLDVEPPEDNVTYRTRAIAGYYASEPMIPQPVRNANLLCP